MVEGCWLCYHCKPHSLARDTDAASRPCLEQTPCEPGSKLRLRDQTGAASDSTINFIRLYIRSFDHGSYEQGSLVWIVVP